MMSAERDSLPYIVVLVCGCGFQLQCGTDHHQGAHGGAGARHRARLPSSPSPPTNYAAARLRSAKAKAPQQRGGLRAAFEAVWDEAEARA